MRALIALTAALVLLSGVGNRQDTKPFTLKSGSVMTYDDMRIDNQGNTQKADVTYSVVKTEGNKFFVDADDGASVAKLVFSYSDEFFLWGVVTEDNTERNNMQVFKLGAKKGDSWKPTAAGEGDAKMTYEDDEELTTPAGKFACKRLVVTAGGGLIKVTFWFADKVGLVKGSKELFGNIQGTIELKKFVEGK